MTRPLIAVLLTSLALAGCYLFNSRDPSPPPQDVFRRVVVFNATEANLRTLRVWHFPHRSVTATGFDITTSGYLRTIVIPDRSQQ